ncbi:MAG TPA: DUF1428 domain-containing protein [Xanthobacteraceae bacterium]|jgi:uncharacterized protein YbaA (DUF1428 family)
MTYIDGFVAAVPQDNKQAYVDHAREAQRLFTEYGALRLVEGWGDDVPEGKITDFRRAVLARDGETTVFSWIEWPSKEARDEGWRKMMADARMRPDNMPFDGKRMIFGGFSAVVERGPAGTTDYVDAIVAPVPLANRAAFIEMASESARLFEEYGALRLVDGWGDDVPEGKITDFRRAVQARDDETIVFSWIEWPSKAARDEAWRKLMADARMRPDTMPFDGKRMIYGGFATVLDA